MAQIQSRTLDLNQIMSAYAPFFAQQAEAQKDWRDRMVAIGSLEDLANRVSKDSQTYKDYIKYRDELERYGTDIMRGSHVPGVMSDWAAAIFKDYGRITGKMERINKDIEQSRTERAANMQSHPGAIFQQNDIYDNIDAVASGKAHINNRFTDSDTITKIMQTQAEYIGQALDEFLQFNPIALTQGYSLEAIQRGGVAPDVLYDIWTQGYSSKLDDKTNGLIKQFMQNAKDAIGYEQFDDMGKGQIDGFALNTLTAMLRKNKFNVIDSGEATRQQLAIQRENMLTSRMRANKSSNNDDYDGTGNQAELAKKYEGQHNGGKTTPEPKPEQKTTSRVPEPKNGGNPQKEERRSKTITLS